MSSAVKEERRVDLKSVCERGKKTDDTRLTRPRCSWRGGLLRKSCSPSREREKREGDVEPGRLIGRKQREGELSFELLRTDRRKRKTHAQNLQLQIPTVDSLEGASEMILFEAR